MSETKKILFIINPISGIGKKNTIPPLVEKLLKHNFEFAHTQYRRHAYEIAKATLGSFDAVIAIGGDGTVNEIAEALAGSNTAMGIIPSGSGNGLARHLKIPLNIKSAIERINDFNLESIDTGKCNSHFFVGTCGFGFDGHIAQLFDQHDKRGFLSYAKLIAKEYKSFDNIDFEIEVDGKKLSESAIMCSVANSSQFGNGFTISPNSTINDGIFELVLLKKFPILNSVIVGTRFFTQSIQNSQYYKVIAFDRELKIQLKNQNQKAFHLDGEPKSAETSYEITIHPLSLKII